MSEGFELNRDGLVIDRSGAEWSLAAPVEMALTRRQPDHTAAMGLTRPNIWSEGGQHMRVDLSFHVKVPPGAMFSPQELLDAVEVALAARR